MHHHHHENKRDKRKERLMRKAQKTIREVAVLDKPVPIIDLGTENISNAIREITNGFEDEFQQSWVEVLEQHPTTIDEVKEIAREVVRRFGSQRTGEKYKFKSLESPITHSDDGDDFTLLDVIPSPDKNDQIEDDNKPKWKVSNNVFLDKETADKLKEKFPGYVLRDAIRNLLGLPPLVLGFRNQKRWHPWEIEVINKYYQTGGSQKVQQYIHRTSLAINKRAAILGIKMTSYNPSPEDVITWTETCSILGVSFWQLEKWSNILSSSKAIFNGRLMRLYRRIDIESFLIKNPFIYDHRKVRSDYQSFIPDSFKKYLPLEVACKQVDVPKETIRSRIKRGYLKTVNRDKQLWVIPSEVKRVYEIKISTYTDDRKQFNSKQKEIIKQEGYLTYLHLNKKHYVLPTIDNPDEFACICNPNSRNLRHVDKYRLSWFPDPRNPQYVKTKFTHAIATCKMCLARAGKVKREEIHSYDWIFAQETKKYYSTLMHEGEENQTPLIKKTE